MKIYLPDTKDSNVISHMNDLMERECLLDRSHLFICLYFFKLLEVLGKDLDFPYVKELRNNLWELRPGKQRYFYTLREEGFYFLHYFEKRTRHTPPREMKKALLLEEDLKTKKFLSFSDWLEENLPQEERELLEVYVDFMKDIVRDQPRELLNLPRSVNNSHIDPPLLWALSLKKKL